MQRLLLFILLMTQPPILLARDYVIDINTQEKFNRVESLIESAVNSGFKDIVCRIQKGTYEYSNSMLTLACMKSDVNLTIEGRGAVLIGKPTATKETTPSLSYTDKGNLLNLWSDVAQSPELIQVLDKEKKECRIRLVDNNAEAGDFIQISQWYMSPRYKVTKVAGGYAYFTAKNLAYVSSKKGWNVNYDFLYGKQYPRYRVFTHSLPKDIFSTDVAFFLTMSNAKTGNITIRGIVFAGSAERNYSGLLRFTQVNAQNILIEDCKFQGCKSTCISLAGTKNVTITRCIFEQNYFTCIYADDACGKICIKRNKFYDGGIGWTNTMLVNLKAHDFVVKDNIFRDFAYGAVGVGVWRNSEKNGIVSGVIENNEIFFTPQYYKDFMRHTLMDSGAIYTWTQNDNVTIRNNYIHDISGVKDNRGIFCDDGAKNVTITGNVIQRIQNSYCIDLREASYVADKVLDYNTGNTCRDNLVDGRIRFFIRDESCRESNNKKIGDRGYKTMKAYKLWRRKIKKQ